MTCSDCEQAIKGPITTVWDQFRRKVLGYICELCRSVRVGSAND